MAGEVIKLPRQCDARDENHERCRSRNAVWVESWQGFLCMVHEKSLARAKALHPSTRAARVAHGNECTIADCPTCREYGQ